MADDVRLRHSRPGQRDRADRRGAARAKCRVPGDWWQLLILAAIFGVINAYIKPIVKLLSLPLNLLTFGLIGFVINTALVMLAAAVSDSLTLSFTLAGWPPGSITLDVIVAAFLTSIVISVVSALIAVVRLAAPGR